MKKLLLAIACVLFCSQAHAASYFISPTGSDSNSGTSSGAPWLTPNHALNCGDTITAASGTYSAANFGSGHWGTVTCAGGNNVAWLICGTFDTCKITSTSSDGMWVSKSFWGVQGWEVSVTGGTNGACFHAGPSGGSVIHHIVFANDVANGCMGGGFTAYSASTTSSVDYIVYIGDVAYNAASGTGACYSGFNIYQPIASDAVAGTHMYVAGNFSYNNVDGSPCSGGLTTDGEGINLDTFDFSQGGGSAYTQQAVVQNNIAVSNGSSGILMENNKVGGSAPTYFKQNTSYGNLKATNRSFCTGLGELYAEAAFSVTMSGNLAMTNAATGCMSDPIYAVSVANGDGTVSVAGNLFYSAAGNTTNISSSPGFSYGSNTTTTNPVFASTTIPGAPSCSGKTNVPNCMATLIANFTPTALGTSSFGYQTPSPTSISDALYPQWLCTTTNLPSGLVTPGCGVVGTCPVNAGMSQSTVQSTITGCGSGHTVTFAAGTYNITSTLTVPCGVNLSGPVVPLAPYNTGDGYTHLGYTPTATIQGSLARTAWLVTLASCSTAQSISYLGFNGETPSGFGGGGLYVPAGNSNLTVQNNYLYGNQTPNLTCCGDPHDSLIWMDGANPANNDQNDTVAWNRFGASGNCSNIMANVNSCNPATQNCTTTPSYQGSSAALTGGYCAGLGIHTGATNLLVENNVFYSMEQGLKHYSGTSNTTSFCNLCTIQNNDFSNIHRIAFETQINPGAGTGTGAGSAETIKYNSYHDPYRPFYGSFAISAANGTSGATNSTFNMLVGNNCPVSPALSFAMADELWGNHSISSNNWFEGCFDNGIEYNFLGNFTIQNNFNCGTGGNRGAGLKYINMASGVTMTPTISGNTPGAANTINALSNTTCVVIASTSPSISPPAGGVSFPLSVTLTDSAQNTSIWYTTNGATPVPGAAGTSLYSAPFTLTSAGTVKAVAMWGAANQPTTYVAGFGFAPSAVVSAAYTGGGTPTAATPVLSPTSQAFTGTLSVSVSDSTPSSTIYCTTNGTTPTTGSPVYSGAFSLSATTTIQCIATAAGFLQSAVGSGSYTLSTPTLTGGHLSNVGSINTLAVGASPIQFTAVGQYSDSMNRNLPDSFGNTAVWASSNSGILTVGSTGLVSCAAAGSADVQVTSSPTSIVFNPWTMNCTTATPTAATPTITPASQTFTGTLPVVITDSTGGAIIYYTLDGSTPTTSSPVYSGTFNVTVTTTVKAIAAATGYLNSAVGSATYMLTAPTISSAYLTIPGNLNYTTVGATVPFFATIVYSDGVQLTSTVVGVANARGDSISSWTTSASGVGTISTSGIMTGVSLGVTHIQAVINGTINSNPWFEYVSASASTTSHGVTSQGVTIQ